MTYGIPDSTGGRGRVSRLTRFVARVPRLFPLASLFSAGFQHPVIALGQAPSFTSRIRVRADSEDCSAKYDMQPAVVKPMNRGADTSRRRTCKRSRPVSRSGSLNDEDAEVRSGGIFAVTRLEGVVSSDFATSSRLQIESQVLKYAGGVAAGLPKARFG